MSVPPSSNASEPQAGSRTAKAGGLALSQVMNLALGLALSAGLSWTIPDRALYGAFQQLVLIYSVLAGPLSVGLPNAVYYFLPRLDPAGRKAFLAAAHGVLFLSGGIVSAMLFFGADVIAARFGSEHLAPLLRVYFPLPLFIMPRMILDPILITQSRVPLLVALQVGTRLVTVLAVLVPTWLGMELSAGIFLWVVFAAASEVLSLVFVFRPFRGIIPTWKPGLTGEIFRFTAPIAAITLVSPIALSGDRLLTSSLFGAAIYAVYANGTYAVSMSLTVVMKASSVLIADLNHLIAAGRNSEARLVWGRASFKTAFVLFAAIGLALGGAEDIVTVLFSSKYIDSAVVMRLSILAVVPRILFVSSVLQAAGRTGWYSSVTLVACITNPGAVLLFGHVLGLGAPGAALGYAVGEWIHGGYQIFLMKRVLGESPLAVFPVRRLASLLALAALLGPAIWVVGSLLLPGGEFPILRLISLAAVFGAVYVLAALGLRIARYREDIAPLLRMARIPETWIPARLRA
jgi:O-antigen/teichoic acid export membrane protein